EVGGMRTPANPHDRRRCPWPGRPSSKKRPRAPVGARSVYLRIADLFGCKVVDRVERRRRPLLTIIFLRWFLRQGFSGSQNRGQPPSPFQQTLGGGGHIALLDPDDPTRFFGADRVSHRLQHPRLGDAREVAGGGDRPCPPHVQPDRRRKSFGLSPCAGSAVMGIANGEKADARTTGQQVKKLAAAHGRQQRREVRRPFRQTRTPSLTAVCHPPPGGAAPHPRRETLKSADRQAKLQRREVAV